MTKFTSSILYRDGMVQQLEENGSLLEKRILTDTEFDFQLRCKLQEEAAEVVKSLAKAELTEEIGDVYEVIDTLCRLHGIEKSEVLHIQAAKRAKRGGFDGRIFVETAAHPEGSSAEAYFLAAPKKFTVIE